MRAAFGRKPMGLTVSTAEMFRKLLRLLWRVRFLRCSQGRFSRAALDHHRRAWRTAKRGELLAFGGHTLIISEHLQRRIEDRRSVFVRRRGQAVMHPFAVAPALHQPRALQICKMPRDLRVIRIKCSRKKTHAYLAVAHQVYKAQPRFIGQRREKQFKIESIFPAH